MNFGYYLKITYFHFNKYLLSMDYTPGSVVDTKIQKT